MLRARIVGGAKTRTAPLTRPIGSTSLCSRPLFDAPQAIEIIVGRPSSRPPLRATESGAVTLLGRSVAEHAVLHGVDRVAA